MSHALNVTTSAHKILCAVLLLALGFTTTSPVPAQAPAAGRPWVLAYYLSGDAQSGKLPVSAIDFHAFTHLIHFGIFPNADGTIDPARQISVAAAKEVIDRAHSFGRPVLVSLGTDEGAAKFRAAITDKVRPAFVRNLVAYVTSHGYDGLDIDMEPIEDTDVKPYEAFIYELRAQMLIANPRLLLTCAVASEPAMFARIQDQFDRIDLMTYDLSGPWKGFKSWYNAGLLSPPDKMNSEDPYPSVDGMVHDFEAAGVRPGVLGIGIAFYGYVWTGVSGPRQEITGVKVDDGVDYRDIMDKYYRSDRYHWDNVAHAPYLSIEAPEAAKRVFVSYDDERLCADKAAYVAQNHLGGAIVWELGGGYRTKEPAGKRDRLLRAVKRAWMQADPSASQ
jgi:chitinase